jgi:hypothetical protein
MATSAPTSSRRWAGLDMLRWRPHAGSERKDRVTALRPARSSRQIVFLMLGAFALFQQEPKIKKCAGSEI